MYGCMCALLCLTVIACIGYELCILGGIGMLEVCMLKGVGKKRFPVELQFSSGVV